MTKKKKLYIASAVALALGFLIAAVFIVKGYSALGDRLKDLYFPGSYEFKVEEPGEYLIYLDTTRSFYDLKEENANLEEVAKMFDINIVSLDSGKKIEAEIKDSPATYTYKGRSGVSLWSVSLDSPGRYSISAVCSDGSNEGFVLTLDKGVYKLRAETVVVAQTVALILFTTSLILFVKGYGIKAD